MVDLKIVEFANFGILSTTKPRRDGSIRTTAQDGVSDLSFVMEHRARWADVGNHKYRCRKVILFLPVMCADPLSSCGPRQSRALSTRPPVRVPDRPGWTSVTLKHRELPWAVREGL